MSRPDRLPRFTPAERYAHRATSALVLMLTTTGLVLYIPSLSLLVGPVVDDGRGTDRQTLGVE